MIKDIEFRWVEKEQNVVASILSESTVLQVRKLIQETEYKPNRGGVWYKWTEWADVKVNK